MNNKIKNQRKEKKNRNQNMLPSSSTTKSAPQAPKFKDTKKALLSFKRERERE